MTSVQDRDINRFVRSIEDVADLFQTRPAEEMLFGVEEEAFFLDAQTLNQATDEQNKQLFAAVPFEASPEPNAAQLEHVSAPQAFRDIGKMLQQMQIQREQIQEACEKIGLIRCPFSSMPHVTGKQAFENLIRPSKEDPARGVRQRELMRVFPHAIPGSPDYPVLNTALHYTAGMRSMDDDLVKGRRAQFLMPFLLTLMENRSPFNQSKTMRAHFNGKKPFTHEVYSDTLQARVCMRDTYDNQRGGLDRDYFTCNSGDELAHRKFDKVTRTPMLAYYGLELDSNGEVSTAFKAIDGRHNKLPTFSALMDTQLGFRTNYYMARSQVWEWLKTKNLFDKEGNAFQILQERRDFDPGIHQIQTMSLILAAIDNSDDVAGEVDDLLAGFGFDPKLWDDNGYTLLKKSSESALYRGNMAYHGTTEYMDIPYGNNKMIEFGRRFADIIENFYRNLDVDLGFDALAALQPMRYIVDTGRTDAQVARDLILSPDDNLPFMREFDPKWFIDPTKSLGMLVDDGTFKFKPKTKASVTKTVANDDFPDDPELNSGLDIA